MENFSSSPLQNFSSWNHDELAPLPFAEEEEEEEYSFLYSSNLLPPPLDFNSGSGYFSSDTGLDYSHWVGTLDIQESVLETIPLMESFPTVPLYASSSSSSSSSPMDIITTTNPNDILQLQLQEDLYRGISDETGFGGLDQGMAPNTTTFGVQEVMLNHNQQESNGTNDNKQIVLYNHYNNGEQQDDDDDDVLMKKQRRMMNKRCRSEAAKTGGDSSNDLSRQTISQYFYMPITQAAKELNVGLTLLKKRCRELGIPRWPHRKLMSLQTLIKNVQEMGKDEEGSSNPKVRDAVELLEQQKKLMEEMPGVQLEEKTKKLRQACFKANYKKRKLMGLTDCNHLCLSSSPSSSPTSSSSPVYYYPNFHPNNF